MITNLDSIQEQLDIVAVVSQHVPLQKKGVNHIGLCPFHSEKTPSFTVSPSGRIFKCFGCGKSGDVFRFQQYISGQSFPEAVEALAKTFHLSIERSEKTPVNDSEYQRIENLYLTNAGVWQWYLEKSAFELHESFVNLDGRKFQLETIRHFGVALLPDCNSLSEKYPDFHLDWSVLETLGLLKTGDRQNVYDVFRNRVLFPILTVNGKVAGFAGRKRSTSSSKSAKYINSVESEIFKKSGLLFGLYENKKFIRESQTAILVEGYSDALSIWEAGFKNVIACCGTAVSEEHARIISKFAERVILIFDGDDAGRKATEKAWRMLEKSGLFVQVCDMPEGKDPDLYIRESGAEAFKNLLETDTVDAVIWFAKRAIVNANNDSLVLHKLAGKLVEYFKQTPFTSLCTRWSQEIFQITGTHLSAYSSSVQEEEVNESAFTDEERAEFDLYGFVEVNRRYFIFKGFKKEPISNFILKPLFQVQAGNSTERVFEVVNVDRQSVVIRFDGRSLVSADAFCQTLEQHGNYVFMGNQPLLKKIKAKLFGALTPCTQIETLGWQPDYKIWAWANGVVSDGEFIEADKNNRVAVVNGKHYRLPEPDLAAEGPVFRYEKGNMTLHVWLSKIDEVYRENDNGILLALYFMSSIFRDSVYAALRFFPMLFGFGQRASGKSTLAWSLSYMYGKPLKQINLSSGTGVGISRRSAAYQNAVVWFDEYKNSLQPKMIEFLKGLYDGAGYLRGQYTNDNRTHATEVNAGIFITGQDIPVADPALFTRIILLQFSKTTFSTEEEQRFRALQEMEHAGGFSWISSDVSQHWAFFQSGFSAGFQKTRNALEKALREKYAGEVEDRLLNNYSILLNTCNLMREKLELPDWFVEKAEPAIMRALIAHLQSLITSDDLAQFWDVFERMAERGLLTSEKEWALQSPLTVTIKNRTGQQEVFQNPAKEQLLFLRLKSAHGSYMEQFRRLYNREGLSKPTLEHYLKSAPAYLGSVDTWRFGDTNTSGLVFRYGLLDIHLKK